MGANRSPASSPDVCIVGSGVAGALVAYELSKAGFEVVVLEAGPRFDTSNRLDRMETAIRPGNSITDIWDVGGERDRFSSSGEVFYGLNKTRVKGVGGTTLHWLGVTPRFHEKDFEMQTRYGLASDWPISYEDLRPYYARAEEELGVAGGTDNPFTPPRENDYPMPAFPPSYSDSLYAEACDELGIEMHSVPQARNSEPYDGRSACVGYSTCIPVCPSRAKYSADVHVAKAEDHGARVIDRAPVQRLEHDDAGETVEAAVYETPDGSQHRQTADTFVLACGAVEIPRLLLLSESETYPNGLANSSGLVGKYFMDHPQVTVTAELDQPTNQEPIGYQTSESHQFYDHEEPTPGSIKLVFMNKNPPNTAEAAMRGGDEGVRGEMTDVFTGDVWGDDQLDWMREQGPNRKLKLLAVPEMLPQKRNEVTLDRTTTDDHGNPVPDVSYSIGSHAAETMEYIRELQHDILDEMGATILHESDLSQPSIASHKLGTTRMGTDPETSVVTPSLRTHDLENLYVSSGSVFVTGGAMNPTLTIAALALRLADHLSSNR
ncbi:GMC family oxidoreductase [Haloarcula onubensis]|uniref:GMC family oxidoreductase n=1 Tax=Haloarcula onubensis TaxID=2950539 RepID=A0ABU2FUT5_9EURY|nr:GMC family oxidoreductase [Halomicroarcula sp. S3CR25-11]MDS0284528.1 GMC family oxidoreductase [Halomicroarcula sp. S3CR25-11]